MVVSKRTLITNYKRNLRAYFEEQFAVFFQSIPDIAFSAIAFEVVPETGEVTVSLNTEFDFYRKLHYYKTQKIVDSTLTEDSLHSLKCTIRDWNYQAIATNQPVDEDVIAFHFQDKPEQFMNLFVNAILEFMDTDAYQLLPKVNDFVVLCIAPNDSIEQAQLRFDKLHAKHQLKKEIAV
ncbi:hypothetical protein G7062_07080 [Erysipelothrix sp. HDW6C]|uniref:hypothetical protein n=1 Tax=Erysipelothrix sp. HDW6C TaxID=2714930 RepID=UPI00140CC648|nr:hypothetical protein [Erysipelothrix sp. HDW6C]QIK70060.1 hypothetical protein G7062_07080 [Erysipelothrix sp. HDW6C]